MLPYQVHGHAAQAQSVAAAQARMEQARAVFRDADTTEFVVVTIPTVMAAAESVRLVAALRKEQVPVRALLVNQARALGVPPGIPWHEHDSRVPRMYEHVHLN